jgi:hypothetical protein
MYCGASGHMAKDCRKRNAAVTPKARAADVTLVDPKPEKMIRSPENAARTLGCVDPIRADAEVRLNVIHSEDSLMLSLSSLYTPDIIPTLVDSGSSHCFIDSAFVQSPDKSFVAFGNTIQTFCLRTRHPSHF